MSAERAAELLAELTRCGITLTAAGDRLQVAAPRDAMTAELRGRIGAQKAALLALLSALPAGCSGQSTGDEDATARPERDLVFDVAAWAPLREILARGGRFRPRPLDPPWADPRPDLRGDHARWTVLLALAWDIDGLDPHGVFAALCGLRCWGAAIATDVQPLDLTPAGPILGWRLTRGEIPAAAWPAYRARWLWPHKESLIRLLRGGQGP